MMRQLFKSETLKIDKLFKSNDYTYDEPFISQHYTAEQIIKINNISCSICSSKQICRMIERNPINFENNIVSPIRRCTMQSIKDAFDESDIASKKILEIGCGDWDFAKNYANEKKGSWVGVDIYKSNITSAVYNGIDLPFLDESFDGIILNQVLEHVHDKTKKSPGNVISHWLRVLKKGGFFFANVPIHLHGSRNFRFGNLDSLIRIFPPSHFSQLKIIYYRRDFSGMAPARILIDYSTGGWISEKYAYISDLDTWKRKPIKQKIKISLAKIITSLIDFIISHSHGIPITAITENQYLKNTYVIDFRAIKT
ncbi:MAG: class I SAM-dependent methyltransferase [Thermoplasmata archaeon]|nr:class I SAM-dependent methyltransferase [Thermoplasmata archaeon]